jgi:hypothetical protein
MKNSDSQPDFEEYTYFNRGIFQEWKISDSIRPDKYIKTKSKHLG